MGKIERSLAGEGAVVRRGGDFDRWDLELRGGLGGSARMLHTVEDHQYGQIGRFRVWPVWPFALLLVAAVLALLGSAAILASAAFAGAILLLGAIVLTLKAVIDSGSATATLARACAAGGSPV
jgi:hypothetical protein